VPSSYLFSVASFRLLCYPKLPVFEPCPILESSEDSISVAIEEINPEDWVEKVYKPEILNNPEKLYKKPGYNPLE
jgi:4-oxalocrotonate tautomerase